MRKVVVLFMALGFAIGSFAQVRKIPAAVTEAFSKKYPKAQEVEYKDNLINVQVHFLLDSARMNAKFNSDGEWKETEKESNYDAVPSDVKDGFQKSKYSSEWKVSETAIIYMPNNEVRYRLKVEKNDVQKKYLFFDKNGKLVKDSITI